MKTIGEEFSSIQDMVEKIAVQLSEGKYCKASYLLGGLSTKCDELRKTHETESDKKSRMSF